MLKKALSVGALALLGGCQCLPALPGLPDCWWCAAGNSLVDAVVSPIGAVLSDLINGVVQV